MTQKKMPPPEGWYPRQYDKVIFNAMKPFNYLPLQQIPVHNRASLPPQQNMQMMDQNTYNQSNQFANTEGYGPGYHMQLDDGYE